MICIVAGPTGRHHPGDGGWLVQWWPGEAGAGHTEVPQAAL